MTIVAGTFGLTFSYVYDFTDLHIISQFFPMQDLSADRF